MKTESIHAMKSALTFLSNLSGLLAIALVIWKGGALAEQVSGHEIRIGKIEAVGSIGLQKHEAKDDERVDIMKAQLASLQREYIETRESLYTINIRIGVLGEKIDNIKEQLTVLKPAVKGGTAP